MAGLLLPLFCANPSHKCVPPALGLSSWDKWDHFHAFSSKQWFSCEWCWRVPSA